jgi:hypothetical protein
MFVNGSSIDASYQVSVHLAEGFQRRRLKCEKLKDDRRRTTDDGRRTPSDGKISHYLWQGELKINMISNHAFIINIYSFLIFLFKMVKGCAQMCVYD